MYDLVGSVSPFRNYRTTSISYSAKGVFFHLTADKAQIWLRDVILDASSYFGPKVGLSNDFRQYDPQFILLSHFSIILQQTPVRIIVTMTTA